MTGSRYRFSRQKACQDCSIAKIKCNRELSGCSRCIQRGLRCLYPHTQSAKPANYAGDASLPPNFNYVEETSRKGELFDNASAPNPTTGITQSITLNSSVTDLSTTLIDRADEDYQTYISQGFDTLEFNGTGLTCPIQVDEIRSRWLNLYTTDPGQIIKIYPPNIEGFIRRILGSYASMVIRGRVTPPLIHSSQLNSELARPPLSTCLSLARMCANLLPESENAVVDLIQREMQKLYEQRESFDHLTLLSATQSLLLYAMVLSFKFENNQSYYDRHTFINLQDIACSSCNGGLLCIAEQNHTRPRWEDWIIAETKRRTLFTIYLFEGVLAIKEGLPTYFGVEVRGLPASSHKELWYARTRQEWEVAYSLYLADWPEGGLRIDELWPTPSNLNKADVIERQRRVDQWLEEVDEFGMMLYAVSSSTHN